jgi:hypothetical protein
VACRCDLLPRGSPGRRGSTLGSDRNPHHRSCNPPSFRRASRHMRTKTATWTRDLLARRSPGRSLGRLPPQSPGTLRGKEARLTSKKESNWKICCSPCPLDLCNTVSLYADDVIIFLHPKESDIQIVLKILEIFGEALGLKTNIQKSNVYPIRCGEEVVTLQELLPCEISSFPCKYLGLPLSLSKLSRNQTQSIIDKIADQLPRWKTDLMTRAGRKVQVQYVMTGMVINLAMAVDLPPRALKDIDKIRKGFLCMEEKKLEGDTARWLGEECAGQLSLEVWAFSALRS